MRPLVAERRYATEPAPRTVAAAAPQGGQPGAQRRDPAPTRMAYRMQRLWLTPLFRVVVRVGVPAFVLSLAVLLWLGNDARRAALLAQIDAWKVAVENRPEFRVNVLQITGASPSLDAAIRDMLALKLPMSSFDIDLEAARARIATLDAVEGVTVRVAGSGALEVGITERVPALVWRRGEELDLLDKTGRRIARILVRGDRPDLPLLAGEGANAAAAEALRIVAAAGPVKDRLRGLVRVGERRWDLVLDRDQKIMLPEEGAVVAVERVVALDQAQDLMNRDLLAVDMRDDDRPTLRLAAGAVEELRRFKELETGVTDQ